MWAGKPLPFAAINAPMAPYADSILLFELLEDCPRALCPRNIKAMHPDQRLYKNIAPEHRKLLAVLIQSKHHGDPNKSAAERYDCEYAKCIDTPLPFVFVLISDSPTAAKQKKFLWPYNGNGYFVGLHDLRTFYGEYLYNIRAESWIDRKPEVFLSSKGRGGGKK